MWNSNIEEYRRDETQPLFRLESLIIMNELEHWLNFAYYFIWSVSID